jgi:hypothetical protein
MINYLLMLLAGWLMHIGKIYYPEKNNISFITFLQDHAFEFAGSWLLCLCIWYGSYLDGQTTYLGALTIGYSVNSIWQGIKNNHFTKL